MTDVLLEREKGQLPVSIGTSLAMESMFGVLPEHETDKPVILESDAVWMNIRTLYRNLVGSVPADYHTRLRPADVAETLISECTVIEGLIGQQHGGRVVSVFYLPSYVSASRRFPNAKHRVPTTDLQRAAWRLETETLQAFLAQQPALDVRRCDFDTEPQLSVSALMLTHYPVDLFNRYRFKGLTLVESHTGAIKPPALWYTKLKTLDRTFTQMPFDQMTLQIFGDGNMFAPMPLKIRRHMQELATKYRWTTVSTKDLILRSIHQERDPVLEGFIHKLYR